MKTIYKYHAPIDDNITIRMPDNAQILCVQVQRGEPYIWAVVSDKDESVPQHFQWRGTGHDCDDVNTMEGSYVGTVQLLAGDLVFHLFRS